MNAALRQHTTVGLTLSLIAILLLMVALSPVRAETSSDFTSGVQAGLAATVDSALQSSISDIKTKDFQSSWDEFGTNILVDGSHTPEDIQKELTDDIADDLRTHLVYDQKDEQYLRLIHSSPEEVMAAENDGGSDILPDNYIDPNPSLEANPDVNPSVLDIPASAIDTTDFSTTSDIISPESMVTLPDTLVPAEGAWKPDEIDVFRSVLDADIPATTATEPSPDTSPTTAPPSSEAPTN